MKKNARYFAYLFERLSKTMKIMRILILFLAISLQSTASVLCQGKMISIHEKKIDLADLIWKIEEETDCEFIFNYEDLSQFTNLNVKEEGSVEEVLESLLNDKDLTFRVKGNVYVINKAEKKDIPKSNILNKQQRKTIKGRVTDKDGIGLPGVSVVIKGAKLITGVATDFDGNYLLGVEINDVLIFSFVGMLSQEVIYTGQDVLNVIMIADSKQMEEVVVVGYGTTKRRDLTGSVATIKTEDLLTETNVASFDQLLSGKLSGVVTTSSSGRPGAKAIVNIRGYSSLTGDNQPLYVIDGVPVLPAENVSEIFGNINSDVNPLSAINPNDIQSIDVLKDASAAAIYGSRAANGVVIVTTKRGRKNQKTRIDFSYSLASQKPVDTPDYMSAKEYRSYMEKVANQTLALSGDGYIDEQFAKNVLNNSRVDIYGREHGAYFGDADESYEDRLTKSSPLSSNYNISVTGGFEKGSFALSANMIDQDGLFVGNELKRYGLRTSLDFEAKKWLTVGGTLNYTYSINKSSDIIDYRTLAFNPTIAPDVTPIDLFGQPSVSPLYKKDVEYKTKGSNILGNVYARVKLMKGLEYKSEVGFSLNDNKSHHFSQAVGNGHKTYSNYTTGNTTFTNTLSYNGTFADKHNVTAVMGTSQDIRYSTNIGIGFSGFANPKLNAFPGNQLESYATYEGKQESILNSYFSRVNYNYDRRYYLTLTGRFDGSDRFSPDDRFAFFPAASASWKISNESFLEDVEFIDDITIKGGYGETGNNNLQPFIFEALYSVIPAGRNGSTAYNGVYGLISKSFPNAQIKWETTKQTDLAFEFSLFNSRLTGSVAYYKKISEDIIAYNKVPLQTGFISQNDNTAEIENKGWEIELGGDMIRTKDFRWNSAFNIAFNKNKLVSLNGSQVFESSQQRAYQEGKPLGNIFGYKVEGIFQTEAEVLAANQGSPTGLYSSNPRVGNYKYKDVSGPDGKPDGMITRDDDITLLGNATPDFYGGFNNSISYKGLSLDFNLSFVQGHERVWGYQGFIEENYGGSDINNTRGILSKTWSADNTGAKRAMAVFGRGDKESSDHRYPISARVHDASFVRLKALTLGYQLPANIVNKLSLRSVKLSLSGTNLITWTDWPGLDPEAIGTPERGGGLVTSVRTVSVYPTIKTFTFGLKIGL